MRLFFLGNVWQHKVYIIKSYLEQLLSDQRMSKYTRYFLCKHTHINTHILVINLWDLHKEHRERGEKKRKVVSWQQWLLTLYPSHTHTQFEWLFSEVVACSQHLVKRCRSTARSFSPPSLPSSLSLLFSLTSTPSQHGSCPDRSTQSSALLLFRRLIPVTRL